MARAKAILQSEYPYNISGRCINREWFNLPMEHVWQICCEELYMTTKIYDLRIHLFVLMSNHYHLIAMTPQSNISQCMHRFVGNVSNRLNEDGNRINQNFAGRHFKTILHQNNHFLNAYKYNYRNPVTAGLCERVEDYRFSTLHGLLGKSRLLIPVEEDVTLFSNFEGTLSWLNTAPSPEKLEAVRYGLKRPYFKYKKSRNDNGPEMNDEELF